MVAGFSIPQAEFVLPSGMNRVTQLVLGTLVLLSALPVDAGIPWFVSRAEKRLQRLEARLEALVPDSLHVQWQLVELLPAGGAAVVSSRFPSEKCAPGSVVKLATAIAALDQVGPGFRFRTEVLADSSDLRCVKGRNLLEGDLHVIPSGDPTLSRRDLDTLLFQVWASGIDSLAGRVLIHAGRFGNRRLGPGWMWDDGSVPWAARLSAAGIEQNCLTPGVRDDGSWELPGSALLRVETHPVSWLTEASLGRRWHGLRDDFLWQLPTGTCSGSRSSERWLPRSGISCNVEHPDSLFRSHVFESIQEHFGQEIEPELVDGNGPEELPARLCWRHESPPLLQMLDTTLTRSWNLGADALFLELGARSGQGFGWDAAGRTVEQHLSGSLGERDWLRLVDGSGMSRYNALSPAQMCNLLVEAERRQQGLLRELLPGSGEGTLASITDLHGVELRAKTGSLRGRHALAGYLSAPGGRRFAFCLVVSGHARGSTARLCRNRWLDGVTEWMRSESR